MHKVLFTLVYHANGGFTHSEAYNLPVYLRTFYLNQLQEVKKQEADEIKAAQKGKPSKR